MKYNVEITEPDRNDNLVCQREVEADSAARAAFEVGRLLTEDRPRHRTSGEDPHGMIELLYVIAYEARNSFTGNLSVGAYRHIAWTEEEAFTALEEYNDAIEEDWEPLGFDSVKHTVLIFHRPPF